MKCNKVVPILRMFDYNKVIEFYVDWLGFKIDWEHTFDKNMPVYMQVSLAGIELQLSEHHGDCSPGAHIHISCTGIKAYHKQLLEKAYKYNKPGLEKTFYGTWAITVNDPFFNKITFDEEIASEEHTNSLN